MTLSIPTVVSCQHVVAVFIGQRCAFLQHIGHRFEPGLATVVTPMLEVEQSEDYEECIIVEQAELIVGETAAFFPKIMPTVSASLPCISLDADMVRRVTDTARRIVDREAQRPSSEIFCQMNDRLVSLLRIQVILEVLYEMASSQHPVVEKPSHGEQVFVDFMLSLSQHYAKRRAVGDYAAEAALSVRHFSSLILHYTGQTPMQWIHLFVIGQARHLLLQSDLQVKEIADRLGFPSSSPSANISRRTPVFPRPITAKGGDDGRGAKRTLRGL